MKSILNIGFMAVLLAGISNVQSAAPTVSEYKVNTPGVINYQGRLKSETGTVYTEGTYGIQFRLYHSASGGTAIWGSEYNVYVKDGYFGVMLGAPGGTELVPNVELWQAMWFDDMSNANDLQLYLGITVLQNESGTAIPLELRAESAPRQQFLNSPFAYRSVQAEYARRAAGDFDVAGDLTVKGDFEAPGKTMTAATASVGTVNSTTVTTGSITVGNEVNAATVAASGALSAGSATISGNATLGGTLSAGSATISGTANVNGKLTAGSITSLGAIDGPSVTTPLVTTPVVTSQSGELLMTSVDHVKIYSGIGKNIELTAGQELNLNTPSIKVNNAKPFAIKTYTLAHDVPSMRLESTTYTVDKYVAVVVGTESAASIDACHTYSSGNEWWFIARRYNGQAVAVNILWIRKELIESL